MLLVLAATRSSVADVDRENVGVLGLEAVHAFPIPPGPVRDLFGLELRLNTPLEDGYPRFYLKRIGGVGSKPDSETPSQPNMGVVGETPYPTLNRGKTITYEGELQARSLVELRRAHRAFKAVFARRVLLPARVIPHALYPGGTEHGYVARCEQADIDDVQEAAATRVPSPHVRDFTIGLRQFDPRYYQAGAHLLEGAIDGLAPVNDGTAPTDPVITVTGPTPASVWRIQRGGSDGGRFLELPVALSAGDTATFDFARRQITRGSDGVDLRPLLTLASDWWDDGVEGLEPGDNVVSATAGAGLRIIWQDASW